MTYNRSIDPSIVPPRIKRLPISPTGFPVPWFVTWFKDGKPSTTGNRCWVCGDMLGKYMAFVLGPMCAINRIISEPPSHRDCAIFSAQACPFLSNPRMIRNEKGLIEDDKLLPGFVEAAGNHIERNPGAVCVWITNAFAPFRPPKGGVLFSVGDPLEVLWFAHGRQATREEVMTSIDTGFPQLQTLAQTEGTAAEKELAKMRDAALRLVPAA